MPSLSVSTLSRKRRKNATISYDTGSESNSDRPQQQALSPDLPSHRSTNLNARKQQPNDFITKKDVLQIVKSLVKYYDQKLAAFGGGGVPPAECQPPVPAKPKKSKQPSSAR